MKNLTKNYAYVDGSFRPETGTYGSGIVLTDQYGDIHKYMSCGNKPELAKMRNVAGEIIAAMLAVTFAKGLGMHRLTIFYDYEGIENWVTGKWKANKPETKKYSKFMKYEIKRGLNIIFHHVKSHAGIHENEEADRLAKLAVGIIKKD